MFTEEKYRNLKKFVNFVSVYQHFAASDIHETAFHCKEEAVGVCRYLEERHTGNNQLPA